MILFDLWDYSDPAASELRFREAVATSQGDERALALTQLARTFSLRGQFDEAREVLDQAKAQMRDGESLAGGFYWIELGRIENSSGNPTEAMPHFEVSLAIADRIGAEYLAGDAAHMLAIAAPKELQPTYGEQALARAHHATDPRARDWRGPISNNLGWSLVDQDRASDAIPYFEESLEYRRGKGVAAPIRIALYSLGFALRVAGRAEDALATLHEALEIGGSAGLIEEQIGECLCVLGRAQEAKQFFRDAHEKLAASGASADRLAAILART